jgi:hypothetical protein
VSDCHCKINNKEDPTAKIMSNTVASKVFDAFEAFQNATIDAEVVETVRNLAGQQTVYPPGVLEKEEYVKSPLLQLLIDNRKTFASSPGLSHVLYAPSSTGKTSSLRYFVEMILKDAGAPALMISGNGHNVNYLDYMASVLRIREGRQGWSEAQWIASMVAGLSPQPNMQALRHAPVLVLDEFNLPGEKNQNINFADSFARFMYERSFTVIFVTQDLAIARDLCKLNQWQKIGPLPGLTQPERWSLKRGELPPTDFIWKDMQWTTELLTTMILKRKRFKSNFDKQVKDGVLEWLEQVSTPTAAIAAASEQLALTLPEYKISTDLTDILV